MQFFIYQQDKVNTRVDVRSYPTPLQDFGPLQTLVDKDRMLGLVWGGDLHFGVDIVQVPFEGVTLQTLPNSNPLTDVTIVTVPQLRAQDKVLLLMYAHICIRLIFNYYIY